MSTTPRTDAQPIIAGNTFAGVPINFARALETELAAVRSELVDATSRLTEIESACDHDWEKHDDSFDHEYGTEVIRYEQCRRCFKIKSEEDVDDSDPPERDEDTPAIFP